MEHLFKSLLKSVGMVLAALLSVELGLALYNQGAYTEPNFFESDPDLGLRLIPDSSMSLAYLGAQPAKEVHINRTGFRGGTHPDPAPTDVVVMGDSLSFGLGVGDDETWAAQLQALLADDTQVINYSVPGYGPIEHSRQIKPLLSLRPPSTLVYPVAVGCCLGTVHPPMAGRVRTQHGWMMTGKAENQRLRLPLPGWAMRWSHLVNVLRRHIWDSDSEALSRAVIEQRWRGLMDAGGQAVAERQRKEAVGWLDLQGPDGSPRSWTHLLPFLKTVQQSVDTERTKVIVLILSQDVLLVESEWSKYGLTPRDTAPVQVLVDDLTASAKALGFSVVDPSDRLAEMGSAFSLPRDWHFSPAGHRAIAEALQAHMEPSRDE